MLSKRYLLPMIFLGTFIGLTSCGKSKLVSYANSPDTLNLAVNYEGESFITFGANIDSVSEVRNGIYTTIDGKELIPGKSLCPMWQELEKQLNITIKDGSYFKLSSAGSQQTKLIDNGFVGNNNAKIDIMQIELNNEFVNAVSKGKILNLSEYEDKLPNLFNFLNNNQTIKKYLTLPSKDSNGIFFAPTFEDINNIQKGFSINVEATRALLDDGEPVYDSTSKTGNSFKRQTNYDTSINLNTFYGGQGSSSINSYIQSMNQEIAVYNKNTKSASTITVEFTKDVITRQNELSVKNGNSLVNVLKNYIDEVYGEYIGSGKIFNSRSEIYTSASACYNADELIALWRCFKTNPNYLTGNSKNTMIPFFPYNGTASKVNSLFEICQMFGLRGTSSEYDLLSFDRDNKLIDGRTQSYTYDCIEKIHAIKDEELTPKNLLYDGVNGTSDWITKLMKEGTGLMCYDEYDVAIYNESNGNSGYAIDEMQPILSPIAKWDVKEYEGKTIVGYNETEDVSYTRFTEDNNTLASSGWCIINYSGLSGERLDNALKLIDYFYSENGYLLENYGAIGDNDKYIDNSQVDATGMKYLEITEAYNKEIKRVSGAIWKSYLRNYMGCYLGIGGIHNDYAGMQIVSESLFKGMTNIILAKANQCFYQSTIGGKNFFSSVPQIINLSNTQYDTILYNTINMMDFWGKSNNPATKAYNSLYIKTIMDGWGISGCPLRSSLEALFATTNNTYLRFYAQAIGVEY